MLKLRDIMTRDVATVTADMTVRDAMGVLTSRHVSGAPVVDGAQVIGVVTATDLLALVATVPHAPRSEDRAAPPEDDAGDDEGSSESALEMPEAAGERDAFYTELWTQSQDEAESEPPASWREWSALDEHSVREAMNDAVISLPTDAPVADAAERMRAAAIHRVLVLDGARLAGIVSVLDIADAVSAHRIASREYVFHTVPRARHTHGGGLRGANGGNGRHMEGEGTLTLADVMSRDLVTVSPELPIRDVIHLLSATHVGGVPVVSGRTVVGVVSAADTARAVAERRSVERRRLFDAAAAFDARRCQLGESAPTTMPAPEADAANEETHADRH